MAIIDGIEIYPIKIMCPFLTQFHSHIDHCPYMEGNYWCEDIECGPGNGDAWCHLKLLETCYGED